MGITITPKKGCWIKYQLALRNLTNQTVANKAGLSTQMVTNFIKGRKNSARIRAALADVLGYPSFEALIAASRGHISGEGGAA